MEVIIMVIKQRKKTLAVLLGLAALMPMPAQAMWAKLTAATATVAGLGGLGWAANKGYINPVTTGGRAGSTYRQSMAGLKAILDSAKVAPVPQAPQVKAPQVSQSGGWLQFVVSNWQSIVAIGTVAVTGAKFCWDYFCKKRAEKNIRRLQAESRQHKEDILGLDERVSVVEVVVEDQARKLDVQGRVIEQNSANIQVIQERLGINRELVVARAHIN